MPERSRRPRRAPAPSARLFPGRDAAVVLAAALALRAVHWLLYSRTPFFAHPVIDASFFDLWARAILQGQPFPPGAPPDVWFKPPLYPYALAALYRLFGPSPAVAYAAQTVLGAATAVLVLGLGRAAFTPAVARGGALAAALLPILPFFELQLVAESLTTFLSLLGLLLLLRARAPASGEWRAGRLVASGLLLGLAALGRPNALVLPPLAAWWVWRGAGAGRAAAASAGREAGPLAARAPAARRLAAWWERARQPAAWRPAALLLLGAALALAPSTARNAAVGRALVPVSANFGVNLWTGNHPGADGVSAVPVGLRWDDLQLRCRQAGRGSTVAASRQLAGEALAWIAAEPGRALALTAKRALVLLNGHEGRNNIGPSFLAREFGVVTLARWWPGTWLLLPFALLGLAAVRRADGAALLLALYLAGLAASVLPFFANARFRAPLLPVAALFAAAAVADLGGRWRAGRLRAAGPRLGLLLAAGLLVNVDWFRLDAPAGAARDHYNLAEIHQRTVTGGAGGPPTATGAEAERALAAAEAHFRRALALDPGEPDYPEGLGTLLLMRAQPWVARAAALRERGDAAGARAADAAAARLLEEALPLHRQAIALLPRSYRSHANLGGALLWLGDGAAGEAAAARAAGDAPGQTAALGRARARYGEAAAALREALRINPAMREAAANLRLCEQRLAALPAPEAG